MKSFLWKELRQTLRDTDWRRLTWLSPKSVRLTWGGPGVFGCCWKLWNWEWKRLNLCKAKQYDWIYWTCDVTNETAFVSKVSKEGRLQDFSQEGSSLRNGVTDYFKGVYKEDIISRGRGAQPHPKRGLGVRNSCTLPLNALLARWASNHQPTKQPTNMPASQPTSEPVPSQSVSQSSNPLNNQPTN